MRNIWEHLKNQRKVCWEIIQRSNSQIDEVLWYWLCWVDQFVLQCLARLALENQRGSRSIHLESQACTDQLAKVLRKAAEAKFKFCVTPLHGKKNTEKPILRWQRGFLSHFQAEVFQNISVCKLFQFCKISACSVFMLSISWPVADLLKLMVLGFQLSPEITKGCSIFLRESQSNRGF